MTTKDVLAAHKAIVQELETRFKKRSPQLCGLLCLFLVPVALDLLGRAGPQTSWGASPSAMETVVNVFAMPCPASLP
jgi:hypothetical protein